jgi:hypothetical protein
VMRFCVVVPSVGAPMGGGMGAVIGGGGALGRWAAPPANPGCEAGGTGMGPVRR